MVPAFLSYRVALAVLLLALASGAVAGHRTDPFEVMLYVQRILRVLAVHANALLVAGSAVLVAKAVLLPAMRPRAPAEQHFRV